MPRFKTDNLEKVLGRIISELTTGPLFRGTTRYMLFKAYMQNLRVKDTTITEMVDTINTQLSSVQSTSSESELLDSFITGVINVFKAFEKSMGTELKETFDHASISEFIRAQYEADQAAKVKASTGETMPFCLAKEEQIRDAAAMGKNKSDVDDTDSAEEAKSTPLF